MSQPTPLLDRTALLAPISAEQPCGVDLSFSAAFDRIALARREDDPTLDQGEWVTSLKQADWPGVVAICNELLCNQTKDLRLAVWLTEALCKTRSFTGLAEGLALLDALCERYWSNLHPLPEGDDQEQRSGNLGWLVQRVAVLLRQQAVTGGAHRYSCNDAVSAQALQLLMDRDSDHAAALAEGKVTLASFQLAVTDSRRPFYEALLRDFGAARLAFTAFAQRIDTLLGGDAPSYRSAQAAFDDVGALIERCARQLGVGERAAPASTGTSAAAPAASELSSGTLGSRAQALQQLRVVADYFRRTEPHSPVAYLAEKAAQWGDMPLHEWLRAVLKDGGTLAQLEEILGVPRSGNSSTD